MIPVILGEDNRHREDIITARVTAAEKIEIEIAARIAGMTAANWVRAVLNARIASMKRGKPSHSDVLGLDTFGQFLRDHTEIVPPGETVAILDKDLYAAFRGWCIEHQLWGEFYPGVRDMRVDLMRRPIGLKLTLVQDWQCKKLGLPEGFWIKGLKIKNAAADSAKPDDDEEY